MAASFLRSGRLASLKCLQVDGWGALRNSPAVWFCSQAKDSTKPVKKTKAAAKTAADDRSALLAHKTAVLFPVRLSEPGALSVQTPGEPEAPISSSAIAEPPDLTGFQHAAQVVADTAPPESPPAGGVQVNSKTSAPEEAPALVPAADDAFPAATTPDELSSSSSSDSDSDSDSEDEELEEQTDTRSSSSECIEATLLEKTQVQDFKGTEGWADAETKHEAAEAVPPTVNPASVAPEESGKLSPEIGAPTRGAAEASRSEVHADVAESASVVTVAKNKSPASDVTQADVPVEVMKNFIKDPAEPVVASTGESQDGAAVSAVTSESAPAEALAAAVSIPTDNTEELLDPAPVSAEAAEALAAAPAAAPAKALAAAPAEAPVKALAAAPAEAPAKAPAEALTAAVSIPTDNTEELVDPAPVSAEAAEAPTAAPAKALAAAPAEALAAAPAAAPAKAPAEALAAAVSIPTDNTEELVDPAPVSAEAAEDELQAETPAEQPKEAAAAETPAPEEPFDNSTYKNYQHHGYTAYTFVDLDVAMAQYRLPQPSSGRPSPRH
ncbi:skin secretory protein xP2 isoform X1 [Nothobranchius furzeri]|uniref:Ice-structuring glycoprotein-like n=1 Tax=Nothobranchius furzeri TaxID=105023 RepID=A0A8C6MD76_NOTFU|nr:ice-structuring glycoprotein [Nothobranchius furzeri]KAF7215192.1 transcript variant X1 [Nothobranchius furzeri]